MQDFIRVVQITDTHLYADPNKHLLGLNTQDSFAAVLQALDEQPWQADLLLLTGDLAQDESLAAYQRLAQQIAPFKTPAYWIPGNHDNYHLMTTSLTASPLHTDKSIIKKNWQFILLNSQIPGKVPGLLAKSELEFLKQCLQQYPQHHTAICFHHPPVPIQCGWLDSLLLQNPLDFFALIDQYPQVKCIINGHIHQQFEGWYKQVPIYTTPSTCIQFKPETQKFALDIIPPGFRYFEFYADGSIKTQVLRATQFKDYTQANPHAKGY